MQTLGWKEWGSLPEIGIERIHMKVDTGAKTSCLHAFKLIPFERNGESWVTVHMHPQQDSKQEHQFDVPVYEQRQVTDSGGHSEIRYVIRSRLILGSFNEVIELTLTNRDTMRFKMLLGRQAMRHHFTVNPAAAHLLGE
ncbi:MAG: ATP-dependent zinc protease [Pseudomonadota bacterium]